MTTLSSLVGLSPNEQEQTICSFDAAFMTDTASVATIAGAMAMISSAVHTTLTYLIK
ncbi:hypothetical protein [Serratia sp. JKS296]|uniref:hypothetical protein n=1 Tax=Serratia sp. JKS296 TaxID=1938824 RepID=UPI001597101A|nr:hypothetical protein [Serratia sp. JKS296]